MAWEWVAPVATGVTAATVAIAGIAATYRTGAEGRKHAETLTDKKNASDQELAREQRGQQRRAEAYLEVLTIAERIGQWTSTVEPMYQAGQPDPQLPDLATQARGTALLNAYGSSKALVFYNAWRKTAEEIYVTVLEILRIHARGEGPTDAELDLRRRLNVHLRQEEMDARKALVDELAAELQGVRRVQEGLELGWKVERGSPEAP
jgi:hypothetical protein